MCEVINRFVTLKLSESSRRMIYFCAITFFSWEICAIFLYCDLSLGKLDFSMYFLVVCLFRLDDASSAADNEMSALFLLSIVFFSLIKSTAW